MEAFCTIYRHEEINKKSPTKPLVYFEIISQECSLGDPFQILFAKFGTVPKHGFGEWGLFALNRHEEILKNSSS